MEIHYRLASPLTVSSSLIWMGPTQVQWASAVWKGVGLSAGFGKFQKFGIHSPTFPMLEMCWWGEFQMMLKYIVPLTPVPLGHWLLGAETAKTLQWPNLPQGKKFASHPVWPHHRTSPVVRIRLYPFYTKISAYILVFYMRVNLLKKANWLLSHCQ